MDEHGLSPKGKERLAWLAFFLRNGSVEDTCVEFGISLSTFYRCVRRFDPCDLRTIEDRTHRPHKIRTSALPAKVRGIIHGYREREPSLGKIQIAERLRREHGINVSASTVGRVIRQDCLYFGNRPLHRKKRSGSCSGCDPVAY